MSNFFMSFVIATLTVASSAYAQAPPQEPAKTVSSPAPAATGDDASISLDPASLIPDLPPLPTTKATLLGGTIEKLDHVRDELTVEVFGGGRSKVFFDPRTRVYRDGRPVSIEELKRGDRVHIDTILAGSTVFASAIRLSAAVPEGENQGIVQSYDPTTGELAIRDPLSPEPVRVHLTASTRIVKNDQTVSINNLVSGTLVSVRFDNDLAGHVIAQQVSILAAQGASFTFVGQVTFLDLRVGLLVLTSTVNHKTYEIYLGPESMAGEDNLREGVDVTAVAEFDGNRYVARRVRVDSGSEK
jgi:hypothetical protein